MRRFGYGESVSCQRREASWGLARRKCHWAFLGSVVKLDSETCDSFISVIPAKAGIQNRSMPQKDLDTKTPWIPAFAGMTCNLTTLPSSIALWGEVVRISGFAIDKRTPSP